MPPQVQNENDFRQLVRRHFGSLPPQQELVGQYLLENIREAPFLSVPELAEKSGASEATVVRFAQRLGYSGFSGLKMDLVDALRDKVVPRPGEELRPSEREDEVASLTAVARQEVRNIQRTLDHLDRDAFREVVATLHKADHIYCFGMGISSYFAELLTYMLGQIGLRATTLSTRFSSPLEQLVPLREGDSIVVLSFPPYSKPSIEVLERAQELGLTTIAVCDRESAPAAQKANQFLTVKTDNVLFTNAASALTLVFNALVTEITVRHQGRTLDAVAEINRILDKDQDLMEDSR